MIELLLIAAGTIAVVALNKVIDLSRDVGRIQDRLTDLTRSVCELRQELANPCTPEVGEESIRGGSSATAEARWLQRADPATRGPSATPEAALDDVPADMRTPERVVAVEAGLRRAVEATSESWKPAGAETVAADELRGSQPVDPQAEGSPVPLALEGIGLETRLGTVWALRIGLGLLAMATAYFAKAIVPRLTPEWKVVLAYAGAAALFSVGAVFERRLQRFARPLMVGGLALGFFVAYAAYFVPAMRAVSLTSSLAWMVAGVVAILVFAERWRSQAMAMLAVILGHVAAFVAAGGADAISLVVITFLSITAVLLLMRHNWVEMALFAVVTAYGSHMLWLFAGNLLVPAERAFAVNLAFFSSYYALFLLADLVWWWRVESLRERALSRSQELIGRLLGPVNLVLFISTASYLYLVTDVYLTDIHWFFFALAVVQEIHGVILKALDYEDYVFYPAIGIVLLTVGFFAAAEALTLNLLLAVEALVLLIVARHTRLWLFHPLAQAVLATNFLHSLFYAPDRVERIPLLFGTLAVVAIYMVQSALEEEWHGEAVKSDRGAPRESAHLRFGSASRRLAGGFNNWRSEIGPSLPYAHAGMGALLLTYQSARFLTSPDAPTVVASAFVLLLVVALVHRSVPFLVGSVFLEAGLVFIVLRGPHGSGWIPWSVTTVCYIGALAIAGLAVRRMRDERDKRVALGISHAVVWGAIVLTAIALTSDSVVGTAGLVWIAALALLFVQQDRVALPVEALASPGDPLHMLDKVYGLLVCILGGSLVFAATWISADSVGVTRDIVVPSLTTFWSAALFASAWFRRRIRLYAAGATLLLLSYALIAIKGGSVIASTQATLWISGVTLAVACFQDRYLTNNEVSEGISHPASISTYVGYALGLLLLFAFSRAWIGFPWHTVAMSGVPFALLYFAAVAKAERAEWVAVSLLLLLVLDAAIGLLREAVLPGEPVLLPSLLCSVLVLAFERLVSRSLGRARSDGHRDPGQAARMALIIGAAGLTVLALHRSAWLTSGWITAGWSAVGGMLMLCGFLWRSAIYRRVSLGVLAVCLVRLFVVDVRNLQDEAKVLAFAALGVCLIAVAWLYARSAGDVNRWL